MNCINHVMRAAPKVMLPLVLCWTVMSQMHVNGVAVEGEPPHQCSIPCCCCATDGSSESDRMVSDMKVWMKQRNGIEFLRVEKSCSHWHSSTLTECLWRPHGRCKHSEVVVVCFCSSNGDTSVCAVFYEHDVQMVLHHS